jgi:hypothetical protein
VITSVYAVPLPDAVHESPVGTAPDGETRNAAGRAAQSNATQNFLIPIPFPRRLTHEANRSPNYPVAVDFNPVNAFA